MNEHPLSLDETVPVSPKVSQTLSERVNVPVENFSDIIIQKTSQIISQNANVFLQEEVTNRVSKQPSIIEDPSIPKQEIDIATPLPLDSSQPAVIDNSLTLNQEVETVKSVSKNSSVTRAQKTSNQEIHISSPQTSLSKKSSKVEKVHNLQQELPLASLVTSLSKPPSIIEVTDNIYHDKEGTSSLRRISKQHSIIEEFKKQSDHLPKLPSLPKQTPSLRLSKPSLAGSLKKQSSNNIKMDLKSISKQSSIAEDLQKSKDDNERVYSPKTLVSMTEELKNKKEQEGTLDNPISSSVNNSNQLIMSEEIMKKADELTDSMHRLSSSIKKAKPEMSASNLDRIAQMSKVLTKEANALKESIKMLSDDIARTKQDLPAAVEENIVNFPYHLFLLELIVNKVQMRCECFDTDCNNLVISASFLGKPPLALYDSSYGKIKNFDKLNVGKSTLFAMTYDTICTLKEFEILLELSKQPPCSHCVTKIGMTRMDFSKEFHSLREELCKKWSSEKPQDNVMCTTSSPMYKSLYYLSCREDLSSEPIGLIEMSIRMSFLGKEILTKFPASSTLSGMSRMEKHETGITMYSSQDVEMDENGKILLDENSFQKEEKQYSKCLSPVNKTEEFADISSLRRHLQNKNHDRCDLSRYDEIYTQMNDNEIKIRVPKRSKLERKYEDILDMCSCDGNRNTGEQIQFELPKEYNDGAKTFATNLKYSMRPYDNYEEKDRKVINITPPSCTVPCKMEKVINPGKDVFILKIGKKMETKDKKTDLEIELVTPKARDPEFANIAQQCSKTSLKTDLLKSKTKKKMSKTSLKGKKSGNKVGKKKSKSK